jgi:cytochrome c oxidase subunit 2
MMTRNSPVSTIWDSVFSVLLCLVFFKPSVAYTDYAEPWQFLFQDPATPIMEGIINLHHDIIFVEIIIGVGVSWMLVRICMLFKGNKTPSSVTHGETLEIVWTIIPSIILMIIGVPSFTLLYSMDEVIDPALTLKVIGRQWYWTYEYSDYATSDTDSIVFDSYMVPTEDLEPGGLRLLEVDNRVVLPVNTHVRVLVTASDVIHCWAVPSFGIKIDAMPGRLNQVALFINREGSFYGQCSELCGVNHGFMPIVVEAVSVPAYLEWVTKAIEGDSPAEVEVDVVEEGVVEEGVVEEGVAEVDVLGEVKVDVLGEVKGDVLGEVKVDVLGEVKVDGVEVVKGDVAEVDALGVAKVKVDEVA